MDTAMAGEAEIWLPADPVEARDWRALCLLGGIAAFIALGGVVVDIALTMMPGWGTDTVPTSAVAWLAQLDANPLLGLRNLDLLNATLSVIALPMYLAIVASHRRTSTGIAVLGATLVMIGTAVFVSANAALPMLEVSHRYAMTTDPTVRTALLASTEALLARGAHGGAGAFPGFLLSELGTLVTCAAMLRGGLVSRRIAWTGFAGAAALLCYTIAYTFGGEASLLVTAVAMPGGLLTMVWQAAVGWRLLRGEHTVSHPAPLFGPRRSSLVVGE